MHLNEPEWLTMLSKEFHKDYFKELQRKIEADQKEGSIVLPFPNSLIYRAFELTPLSRVKVVILGQDPYPNLQSAMGLAFSVPGHKEAPPTLKNIFKELKSDTGIVNKFNDLSMWAYRGVFLLNTILTANAGKSGSHKGYGWELFTDEVIKIVCKNTKYVVYWLLGNDAQEKEDLIINNSKPGSYDLIKLPHPSPNSAHKGFFWSKPFSKTNELLAGRNIQPLDWQL